jgi:hypothetical protein
MIFMTFPDDQSMFWDQHRDEVVFVEKPNVFYYYLFLDVFCLFRFLKGFFNSIKLANNKKKDEK